MWNPTIEQIHARAVTLKLQDTSHRNDLSYFEEAKNQLLFESQQNVLSLLTTQLTQLDHRPNFFSIIKRKYNTNKIYNHNWQKEGF